MAYSEKKENWRLKASCIGTDPESFFPEHGDPIEVVFRICNSCEVKKECLAFAIEHELSGIWGGTTELKRQRWYRSKRNPAA